MMRTIRICDADYFLYMMRTTYMDSYIAAVLTSTAASICSTHVYMRQTYFITIYHFDVAGSGSVNVDRPIKICHVSACHMSTNSRPVRNFFSNLAYWWAVRSKLGKREPSDQNMPRVNMPRVNIFPPNKRHEPIGD
jgi:hypothetical protein